VPEDRFVRSFCRVLED